MRIAVTGAVGFIGHEIVTKLLDDGHEVIAVDFYQDRIGRYEMARLPILSEVYRGLSRCSAVVEPWAFLDEFKRHGAQVVVHAGAAVNTKDLGTEELYTRNITFTEMLSNCCDQAGANLIFISSAAVYGTEGYPNNPYGLTKAMGERIVQRIRTKTASLRLFNVFGRNEHHKGDMASVPWKIADSLTRGREFALHSLEAKRDFVPSSSVVAAVAQVIDEMMGPGEKWHKVYDVGTGVATSFEDLRDAIVATRGSGANLIRHTDMPADIRGRYQFYTCAGEHGVENIGGKITTGQGIWRMYGQG